MRSSLLGGIFCSRTRICRVNALKISYRCPMNKQEVVHSISISMYQNGVSIQKAKVCKYVFFFSDWEKYDNIMS